jgi:hypothetical protein
MSQAYSPLIHTGSTGRPTPSSSPAHPAPPRFLEPLTGKYDQLVDLRGEELCVRYCFARIFTGRSQGYVELLAQSLGMVKDDRDLPVAIECGTALYYPHSKKTERLTPPGKEAAYRQLIRNIEELLREKLPSREFEPKCYMVTINPEPPNETTDQLLPKVYRIIEDAGYGTDLQR